jgi:hypothetical protein
MTDRSWSSASTRLRDLLEGLWSRLDDQAAVETVGPILSAELQIATSHGPLRLGRDPDGMRHLLVPIAPSEQLEEDRRSAGVHLLTRTLLLGDELPVRYADIACRRRDLHGTFTGLIADICARVATEPENSAFQIARALHTWRLLFGGAPERWTTPRLAGLFAELTVLEELLSRDSRAVRAWLGPLGCPQDFRGDHHAVEVKGTTSAEGRVIRIHGADQLETPPHGTLSLAWFRVATSTAPAARTVADLLEACRSRIHDLDELERRLIALGLAPASEGPVSEIRFLVSDQRWYEVTNSFPRIVPESFGDGAVPAGVTDVEYQVDLDTVSALESAEATLNRLGADL